LIQKGGVMSLKRVRRICYTFGLIALCAVFFSFFSVANALEIVLEPSNVQREVGDLVRVQIYADPAVNLISMGVKVSFDPAILQVVSAAKYEDFNNGWIMDADGDSATDADQYFSPAVEIDNVGGSVVMIGGRLMGTTTAGLSDKVLLGWIFFDAIANGTSNLNVDLAKYHPSDPAETFDNFVRLDGGTGAVDEPSNVPGDLGAICVVNDACESDLHVDNIVNGTDVLVIREEWLKNDCNAPGVWCKADINGDGIVNGTDVLFIKEDWLRTDCSCP
jgi:Dockerin type I domain